MFDSLLYIFPGNVYRSRVRAELGYTKNVPRVLGQIWPRVPDKYRQRYSQTFRSPTVRSRAHSDSTRHRPQLKGVQQAQMAFQRPPTSGGVSNGSTSAVATIADAAAEMPEQQEVQLAATVPEVCTFWTEGQLWVIVGRTEGGQLVAMPVAAVPELFGTE